MASPITGAGAGALGGMAAKLMLKASLSILLNTKHIVDYLAKYAYEEETGEEFDKLKHADKMLWITRAQNVIKGMSNTVSF